MYILGHVGPSAAVVDRLDKKADLRLAAALSLLPDIIDKPIALLFPVFARDSTRSLGHTLLVSLLVVLAMTAWRGRTGFWLGLCCPGHLVLDRMWLRDSPRIALWPLLGAFPSPVSDRAFDRRMFRYDLAGEVVGALIVLWLAREHGLFEEKRWRAFLRSGRLG